jgi:hypothetical protein
MADEGAAQAGDLVVTLRLVWINIAQERASPNFQTGKKI